MISAHQIRAARALLGISADELARRSGISHRTIQSFEAHSDVPENRLGNLEAVERTLREMGIHFLGDPVASPGVQLQKRA